MRRRLCPACRSRISPGSDYCGACGVQLRRSSWDASRRAVLAIGVCFAGVLLTLVLVGSLAEGEGPHTCLELLVHGGEVVVGILAAICLGKGALRSTLAWRCSLRGLLLAVPVAVSTLVAASAWVGFLFLFVDGEPEPWIPDETWPLTIVLLPALLEEWLCRGVLWRASEKVTGRWSTILLTATLFAFMHGVGEPVLLAFPHRFYMGVAVGWLRARTGSLLPCILAHGLHNATVVVLG